MPWNRWDQPNQKEQWPVLLIIAFLILVALSLGCAHALPTGLDPTGPTHPNELLVITYTQCYADHLDLGPITVGFFEEKRPIGDSFAAGNAWPGSRHVEYYGPWIRGARAPYELAFVAVHEVIHLSGVWVEEDVTIRIPLILSVTECY